MALSATPPRLLAFYLPQFHPIPENDEWWGEGFTEWTNVRRARPMFDGHPQPVTPGELGYYDLRSIETRRAQADLARTHGVSGFCYYHYWFNGRRLLGGVLDAVLADGQPDLPFCLCWANESWTRAWDGLDRDVLLRQTYGAEDDRRHIRWLARVFADPRYIRVDGKPLMLVYRTTQLPSAAMTAMLWREEIRALGFEGLYLCSVEGLSPDRRDPSGFGFDAAVEFQPDWHSLGDPAAVVEGESRVFDYRTIVARMLAKPPAPYARFPCVTTGWDNSPRRRRAAMVLSDSTPQAYGHWLQEAIDRFAAPSAEENLVFINAWNEWGEGAHLEPSARWGRAYLETTRQVISRASMRVLTPPARTAPVRSPRVTVAVPTCNGAAFIQEAIASILAQTFDDFELLIVDDASDDDTLALVAAVQDPRLSIVRHAVRRGLVANWNRCLDAASGEYITIFHQDDVMAPDSLARRVAVLDAESAVAFVHSKVWQIGPDGTPLPDAWPATPADADAGVHAGREYFSRLFRDETVVCCPAVMMRRHAVLRHGGFDAHLPFTAGLEMWMRLCLFHDVAYLAEPLVSFRRHAAAETGRFQGARGLEQSFMAKHRLLHEYAAHLPDGDWPRVMISQYEEEAIRRTIDAVAHGRAREAQDFLALVDAVRLYDPTDARRSVEATVHLLVQTFAHAEQPWRERVAALAGEVTALRRRCDELEAAVNDLRSTRSWRVTAPLRFLSRAFNRRSG